MVFFSRKAFRLFNIPYNELLGYNICFYGTFSTLTDALFPRTQLRIPLRYATFPLATVKLPLATAPFHLWCAAFPLTTAQVSLRDAAFTLRGARFPLGSAEIPLAAARKSLGWRSFLFADSFASKKLGFQAK